MHQSDFHEGTTAWTSSAVRIRTIKLVISDLLEFRNCTSVKAANVWAKAFSSFESIV